MLLCLGLGSLFNHSNPPNLDYRVDEDNLIIKFYAAKDIDKDEELTIFYGVNLWFDKHIPQGTNTDEDDESFLSKLNI